jgi:hypothetical protein
MTAQQFTDKLQAQIREISQANDRAVRLAALSTNALVSKRIYEQGGLKDSQRSYKSKSYVKKRAARGFETGFVNLTFEGTLKSDTENSVTQKERGVYQAGIKNAANLGKLEGANERYGNPFTLTADEAKAYQEAVKFEMKRFING